jgi:hypothetical protein
MIGWYCESYMTNNEELPIFIYKNNLGKNVFVLKITDTIYEYPDNNHKWICQGELVEFVNQINFTNDLRKNKSEENPNKKRRL